MHLKIAAALLVAILPPAALSAPPASAISAGQFLARAEPLMKKSKMAVLVSSDARQLMRILGDAAQRNRARLEADRAAGRPVTTCLPAKGKAAVDANELLAYLRALPAAQRSRSFDDAFAGYTARKYPCRR